MKLLKYTIIFVFIFSFINANAQTEVVDTTDQEIYTYTEVQPVYPGGDEARLNYLAKNITYPEDAKESGVQGTVYVTYVVEKDGSITNVKVLRGVSPSLDEVAVNAIKGMPNWKPGFQKGKAVRAQFNMPIRFILAGNNNYSPVEKGPTKKEKRKQKRALKKKQRAEANAQTEQVDTTDQEIFVFVEVQPQYIGGDSARLEYLASTIIYPNDAMESGLQGSVYVTFVVEKDGSITNAKVIKGISSSLDKESLNAVNKMPKWKPGLHEGKAVRCQFNMPIKFEIISYPDYIISKKDTSLGAETPPEFIGGDPARLKYLSESVVYPREALYKGIQGTVYVTFVVEKDGSISNVQLLRGIGGGCDEAAINAVKSMPNWKPGFQRGRVVRAQFNMPISFILNTRDI